MSPPLNLPSHSSAMALQAERASFPTKQTNTCGSDDERWCSTTGRERHRGRLSTLQVVTSVITPPSILYASPVRLAVPKGDWSGDAVWCNSSLPVTWCNRVGGGRCDDHRSMKPFGSSGKESDLGDLVPVRRPVGSMSIITGGIEEVEVRRAYLNLSG